MQKDAKVLVVGHGSVIDRSLTSYFKEKGDFKVDSTFELGLDTTIQPAVYEYFSKNKPDYVFLSSVRSGGIQANIDFPAEFIYQNMESQNNVVYAAHKFETKKLVYFAGSCVYPKSSPQPIKESALLSGELEESSEPYSISKIAGIKLCQAYKKQFGLNAIVIVPATIYGPFSDTDAHKAHVMGALLGKFDQAVEDKLDKVSVWGTGEPRREFLYVDDFLAGVELLTNQYDGDALVNLGSSSDVSINELARIIADTVGFKGQIEFDKTKPDGVKQKLLDSSRAGALGFKARVSLQEGISKTYQEFQKEKAKK